MISARPLVAAIPWQRATVRRIEQSTPHIKTFTFALEQPMAFQAGQHVDVRLTAEDGYRALRSYSIASAPGDGCTIDLAIELRGPLGGYFLWPDAAAEPVLLVGGGSGVVPLLSMVRYRAAAGDTRPTLLLYSARNIDEMLAHDELLALDTRGDGFTLTLALTRGMRSRAGDFARRIDASMAANVMQRLPSPPAAVFICGSNGFVSAASVAVIAAGIPAGIIRTERYGA